MDLLDVLQGILFILSFCASFLFFFYHFLFLISITGSCISSLILLYESTKDKAAGMLIFYAGILITFATTIWQFNLLQLTSITLLSLIIPISSAIIFITLFIALCFTEQSNEIHAPWVRRSDHFILLRWIAYPQSVVALICILAGNLDPGYLPLVMHWIFLSAYTISTSIYIETITGLLIAILCLNRQPLACPVGYSAQLTALGVIFTYNIFFLPQWVLYLHSAIMLLSMISAFYFKPYNNKIAAFIHNQKYDTFGYSVSEGTSKDSTSKPRCFASPIIACCNV